MLHEYQTFDGTNAKHGSIDLQLTAGSAQHQVTMNMCLLVKCARLTTMKPMACQ